MAPLFSVTQRHSHLTQLDSCKTYVGVVDTVHTDRDKTDGSVVDEVHIDQDKPFT